MHGEGGGPHRGEIGTLLPQSEMTNDKIKETQNMGNRFLEDQPKGWGAGAN